MNREWIHEVGQTVCMEVASGYHQLILRGYPLMLCVATLPWRSDNALVMHKLLSPFQHISAR